MISTVVIYSRPFEHLHHVHFRWSDEYVERVIGLLT